MPQPSLPQRFVPTGVMLGIALKVISVTLFLGMSGLIKGSGDVPVGQIMFYRSAFAMLPIVVFLAWRRELVAGLSTSRPWAHFGRGLLGVGGMVFTFIGLTNLPLTDAVTIAYANPLMIVVFGAIFLHENVRIYRWTAVAIGLVGVAIIVAPNITVFTSGGSPELAIGAAASLTACIFAASATLAIRNLVQTERSATIAFYFAVVCTCASLLSLPFGWIALSWEQTAMLVLAGISGGVGQILLTEAFRHGEVSVIAPFEYTSLILSIIVGYVFFGDIPTITMLVGSMLLVGAGIFLIFRERQLGIEQRKAREAAPPPA